MYFNYEIYIINMVLLLFCKENFIVIKCKKGMVFFYIFWLNDNI